jgi:hypothetical protein
MKTLILKNALVPPLYEMERGLGGEDFQKGERIIFTP